MEQLLGQGDFQKQFDDIIKEMGDVVGPSQEGEGAKEGAASSSKTETEAAKKGEDSFQETIRRTMERMQESGDAASAAAATSSQDDILAQMLKEMEQGGFGGEGSEEDFSKILMGMMEQLTNKDILYEPMKELNDKYPAWMEKNKGKVEEKDLKRYEEQQVLVQEITARFERKGFSDENAQDREYIVERMQKVCFVLLSNAILRVIQETDALLDASCRLSTARPRRRYERCPGSTPRDRPRMSYTVIPRTLGLSPLQIPNQYTYVICP